jgi:exonuclease III
MTYTHPGTVTIATFAPPDHQPITLISLYGQMIDGHSISTLHRILSDLTPILGRSRKRVILGGDFNASPQFDRPPKYQAHRILFDRVRNFGLIDCLNDGSKGTWRAPQKTLQYYQLDYLFVSESICKKLISCDVIDSPHLHGFSDHNPVVAVFDL